MSAATDPRTAGRIAGLIYLGVVVTGIFALAYAPGTLKMGDDPAAALEAMSGNTGLFRASIYAGFVMCAFFLALPFALARFLSDYGRRAAWLMIAFVAASIPFSVFALMKEMELANLVAAGAATPDLVADRLAISEKWMGYASIFWGLWLAPLGWLILKSGAIPRALGGLLIIGCVDFLASYIGPRLYDGYDDLPFRNVLSSASSVAEIGTCLWLVIMGARGAKRAAN